MWTYSYGTNDFILGVAAVPEPGAYPLIATVMLAAAVLYKRRKALRG